MSRNYDVEFTRDGSVLPLAVIAGEISTGKSSVLEFIDYCLGHDKHPNHPEIERRARSSLLEVEIAEQVLVIERPLFTSRSFASVHYCSLRLLDEPHTIVQRPLNPPGDPRSLSSFLLGAVDMAGLRLRERPSQVESKTDPLSFRDVMWLCFLENKQLDNRDLLFENTYMKHLKLVQVIELIFGVYEDEIAVEGQRLAEISRRIALLEAELESLHAFLMEQGADEPSQLREQRDRGRHELDELTRRISLIDDQMRASTEFSRDLRAEHDQALKEVQEVGTRLRDRETLLRRLIPLRGQYGEDLNKLQFYQEARQLFDPLSVKICPVCLSQIPPPVIAQGHCSLCKSVVDTPAPDASFDIRRELTATRLKLTDLTRYVDEVSSEVTSLTARLRELEDRQRSAQRRLDDAVGQTVAPFLSERDSLTSRREDVAVVNRQLDAWLTSWGAVDARRLQLLDHQQQAARARARIRALQQNRPSRDQLVEGISRRYRQILEAFRFPKLSEAYVDSRFTPFVRGRRYDEIGSTGGLTLVSLAWHMAIFEEAIERRALHPGFLMIDSPQKNLTGQSEVDEFRSPAIVGAVYEYIATWAAGPGKDAQLILVDNQPPSRPDLTVIARYSGDPLRPPYGLIDDEVS